MTTTTKARKLQISSPKDLQRMAEANIGKTGNAPKKAKQPKAGAVTVKEFNWGSLYTGTKEALIRAGLMGRTRDHIPSVNHDKEYRLPLDWSERYQRAHYGTEEERAKENAQTLRRWEATAWTSDGKEFRVTVRYEVDHDMAFRQRAADAVAALRAVVRMVEAIAPEPVHRQLEAIFGIKAEEVTERGE